MLQLLSLDAYIAYSEYLTPACPLLPLDPTYRYPPVSDQNMFWCMATNSSAFTQVILLDPSPKINRRTLQHSKEHRILRNLLSKGILGVLTGKIQDKYDASLSLQLIARCDRAVMMDLSISAASKWN